MMTGLIGISGATHSFVAERLGNCQKQRARYSRESCTPPLFEVGYTFVGMSGVAATVADRLGGVVFGEEDTRVRAIWRVLLAMPLLWILTGDVLTANVIAVLFQSVRSTMTGLVSSLLHGGFLLIALILWARYIDRHPLSNYGISGSAAWLREFLIGVVAVIIGQLLWIGIGSVLGGKSVQVSPSTPDESILFWLVFPFVALVLHAAVQQVVFFRVILKNAAEGLHSRGVDASQAVLAGVPVAVVFFIAMHGSATPLRVLDLAIAGGIFGLMSLHTGELGLGIGAHFGAFYSGTVVFAVLQVTGSLSGVFGTIDQYGFPKMVLAYLVVVAWLLWQHGDLPLQHAIARWNAG
jgi:hypothetical protein